MIQNNRKVSFQLQAIIFSGILLLVACQKKQDYSPKEIINKSIEAHGGQKFDNSTIEFAFRGRHYKRTRNNGNFSFSREWQDTTGSVIDLLNNKGFKRTVNGKEVKVSSEWQAKYSSSINSVIYFALLPFRLNDAAVIREYLFEQTVKGNKYHLIKVTFQKEGGGEDFQDVFVYWVNTESFEVDYFAYSYETDGGGIRFREAKNKRRVNGILIQDYNNYKAELEEVEVLSSLAEKYEKGQLPLLSEINLENISVEILDTKNQ